MTRITLLACALAALALPAAAQTARKPDITKELIGTWEGPYTSEAAPPGSLRLVVALGENQEWKVTLDVISDQAPPSGEVRNFTVDGNTVSWVQSVGDLECSSNVTLVAGILKGGAECLQNGALVLTAGFLLEKKKT